MCNYTLLYNLCTCQSLESKNIPQAHLPERIAEQIVPERIEEQIGDIPVPPIVEETVDLVPVLPYERLHPRGPDEIVQAAAFSVLEKRPPRKATSGLTHCVRVLKREKEKLRVLEERGVEFVACRSIHDINGSFSSIRPPNRSSNWTSSRFSSDP